jgi:tetratricopeptide (TPR) repeat protein
MSRQIPSEESLSLGLLRRSEGVEQAELAATLGTTKNKISSDETTRRPPRERLDWYAGGLGKDENDVEQALWTSRLLLPPSGEDPGWPGELSPAQRRHVAKAAARLARRAAHAAEEELARRMGQDLIEEERRRAAALCEPLRRLSARAWRGLMEALPHRLSWGVCERLAEESERAAADSPGRALELAELSLEFAARVPGNERWRERLCGFCWAFVANARRVASDLPGADAAFAEAWRLWEAGGAGERGPLDASRPLDLEASLRRDQRRFSEALDLLDRGLALCGGGGSSRARILLKKGATLEQRHDYEAALVAYDEAEPFVAGTRQPRLLFALHFNRSAALAQLGRASEAQPLYLEARTIAERLRLQIDRVRLRWLEGKLAAGQGRVQEALAALDEVRQAFVERAIAFDAALVTLEMAVLLADLGRTAEVQALARRTAPLFEQQGVDREALACFLLFHRAAAQEAVTAELARSLVERLKQDARRR